jgi:hypothetical protein
MNYLQKSVLEHITEQMGKNLKQEDIFRDIAVQIFDGIR